MPRLYDSRLNQGYQSLLYLCRFIFYLETDKCQDNRNLCVKQRHRWIAFSRVGCSWRFGPLRKTSSRQSFYASVLTFSKKHFHTACTCEDSTVIWPSSPLNIAIAMAPVLSSKVSSCRSTSGVSQDSFRNPGAGKPRICQDNGSEYHLSSARKTKGVVSAVWDT